MFLSTIEMQSSNGRCVLFDVLLACGMYDNHILFALHLAHTGDDEVASPASKEYC